MIETLDPNRIAALKRAYTTRRVPAEAIVGLEPAGVPTSGDLVLARVDSIGQHTRLESPGGRRQHLFPGDEILVCYANRYAPAQFEAMVPAGIGPCDLVAGGGVASQALCRHDKLRPPTQIEVLGFVTGPDRRPVNLASHRIPPTEPASRRPPTIIVAGTSMDSGKTTTAAGIIRGLIAQGHRVGAIKSTGTGAGGDRWRMVDSGASTFLDFIDVGMASTYLMDDERILEGFVTLNATVAAHGVEVTVVEIADGLHHDETRNLLSSEQVRSHCDGVVFAASDAAGAVQGVEELRAMDLPVLAVSGLLTASPLATREARCALDVPVLGLAELWAADHQLVSLGEPGVDARELSGSAPFMVGSAP